MASGGEITKTCVKKTLLKSIDILTANLKPSDIQLTLQAEEVLDFDDAATIESKVTNTDKVKALVGILVLKPVSAYEIFMNALEDKRDDLYTEVKAIEKEVRDKEKEKEDKGKKKGAVSKNEPASVPPQPSSQSEFDVMISYQWDAQDRMLLLKRKLIENGRSVWMDVDQIVGNLNDRMAEGVAKSKAIIICCSQKYHDSVNCKKEAELASRRKKKLIPLKYTGYDETGWLDLIVGGLLYYDVSTDEALNNNFDSINRAVEKAINQSQQ